MNSGDKKAIQIVKQIIENEGGTPGNSIHSWRCEYPEQYGPCDCTEVLAEMIVEALSEGHL